MTTLAGNAAPARVCIPVPQKHAGGMYTFLDYWRRWLEEQGISHTQDLNEEYDILFVNSFMVPYRAISREKRSRPELIVVQRIDGSARDYGRRDDADDRQGRVNMLADLTIFQSKYSKYSTRRKFRIISRDGPIIYNAVDTRTFAPSTSSECEAGAPRICIASFSTNRMKGTWQIAELARRCPAATFVLCGRYPELPKLPNIQLQGHLNRSELAGTMRSCHVFLHLAENDPCPNVVLEALASGLPVLYRDSGGTPELVGDCGAPITVETFERQLGHVMGTREALSKAARETAVRRFALDRVFPRYLLEIARAERQPVPTFRDCIRLGLEGYPVWPFHPRSVFWQARRAAGRARGRTRKGRE